MDKKQEDFFTGIGLVVALVVVGIALPVVFQNIYVMMFGTLLVIFGICGWGIELDKIQDRGYTNIFLGLGFILLGTLFVVPFPNIFTKIFFLITLLIGVFGFISGMMKFFAFKKETESSKTINSEVKNKNRLTSVVGSIVTLTGFFANIFTILAFFMAK